MLAVNVKALKSLLLAVGHIKAMHDGTEVSAR